MSTYSIKRDKSEWLSSRLNIAVTPGFPEIHTEENVEKYKTEKYNWLSSRLKIKSKPILPENQLEEDRQCIKTEEISKFKDLQIPVSKKLSISRSQCLNNIKTYLAESTIIGTYIYESKKQKADQVITTDIKVGDIQCDQCPFIAKTKNGIKLHVAKIHKPPSYCKTCDQLFPQYHKHCKLCTFVVTTREITQTCKIGSPEKYSLSVPHLSQYI